MSHNPSPSQMTATCAARSSVCQRPISMLRQSSTLDARLCRIRPYLNRSFRDTSAQNVSATSLDGEPRDKACSQPKLDSSCLGPSIRKPAKQFRRRFSSTLVPSDWLSQSLPCSRPTSTCAPESAFCDWSGTLADACNFPWPCSSSPIFSSTALLLSSSLPFYSVDRILTTHYSPSLILRGKSFITILKS